MENLVSRNAVSISSSIEKKSKLCDIKIKELIIQSINLKCVCHSLVKYIRKIVFNNSQSLMQIFLKVNLISLSSKKKCRNKKRNSFCQQIQQFFYEWTIRIQNRGRNFFYAQHFYSESQKKPQIQSFCQLFFVVSLE